MLRRFKRETPANGVSDLVNRSTAAGTNRSLGRSAVALNRNTVNGGTIGAVGLATGGLVEGSGVINACGVTGRLQTDE